MVGKRIISSEGEFLDLDIEIAAGAPSVTTVAVVQQGDFSGDGRPRVTPLHPWGGTITRLPVPADTGFDGAAVAWSPGGQFLAYSDGTTRPTVYEVVGGRLFKLADLPAASNNVDDISWSPDGRWLAGLDTDSGGPGTNLNVWERTGVTFALATIPDGVGRSGNPTWSPDSRFLFVTSANLSPFVHIFELTGSGLNTFTKLSNPAALPTGRAEAPAWAPHGRLIALVEGAGSDNLIAYRYDGNGTFVKIAGPDAPDQPGSGTANTALDWSPDGRHLAVGDGTSGKIIVYRVTQDGSTWTRVATSTFPAFMFNPRWSPDGRFISAAQSDGLPHVAILTFDPATETLGIAADQPPDPLSDATNATLAEWSPDQQYLALAHEFESGPTGLTVYQTGLAMADVSNLSLVKILLQGS